MLRYDVFGLVGLMSSYYIHYGTLNQQSPIDNGSGGKARRYEYRIPTLKMNYWMTRIQERIWMSRVFSHTTTSDHTVKLFFVQGEKEDAESRRRYAEEALDNVAKVLGVDKFDTLILSLPGVVLEKDEEDYASDIFPVPEETLRSWVKTWKVRVEPKCS